MMRMMLAALVAGAVALAPAAGAGTGFKDRAAFQHYVAGYLHIRSVSCTKLNARIADCTGSDHHRYVVACAKITGDKCRIVRYA